MSGAARAVFDDRLTGYDFGPHHPLAPVRLDLTMRLAEALGVLDQPDFAVVAVPDGDDEVLATVHEPAYVDAVRRCSARPQSFELAFGLGTGDNPTFAGMHAAASIVVRASVEAARLVWEGHSTHAVNIAGGLHHAMPGWASGFCVYNDPAIAVRWLLAHGCERVAYVDVDVHHGDGVQAVFYDDPRVLTISLHESGRTLFPGTGFPDETGTADGAGYAVNVALPPGTGDAGWLRAFHAVVPPLLRAFAPTVLVSQHGCDSHLQDPLAHLTLTVDGQRASALALHALSHELCAGRWVATGGGGYALVEVVPRTWSHLLAVAAGQPLDPQLPTPTDWQNHVRSRLQRVAPGRMTDGADPRYADWGGGYDAGSALDRAVMATREAVFPAHGIDPLG